MTLPSVSLTAWHHDHDPTPTKTPEATALEQRGYEAWLTTLFPSYVTAPLGDHHHEVWQWAWAMQRDVRPSPMVLILARGGAKSTTAELLVTSVGARDLRKFVLYVCQTQDQADDHVQNIAGLLERPTVEQHYPALANRAVGKYGNSKGWRRNRLRTQSGFTVDALGLDVAARGVKLDEYRPDLIIFDDIDGELDTLATTEKKIAQITKKILPAGADNLATLAVQNLVIPDGVFARLSDGRADFLQDRTVIGPVPALHGMAYEQRDDGRFYLTAGVPSWDGQDMQRCQEIVNDSGISAFLSECQHEVEDDSGGHYAHITFRHCRRDEVPHLVKIVVWCDPAISHTDTSDANGIQIDGIDTYDTIYRLYSYEERATPLETLKRALLKAVEYGALHVGVETDQGGNTWLSVYRDAWRELVDDPDAPHITKATPQPGFRSAKAGAVGSKEYRQSQMVTGYERGTIIHVYGTHDTLEKALKRFPLRKPFDLADAAFWAWDDLQAPRTVVQRPQQKKVNIWKQM